VQPRVLTFCRYPEPGAVKTRLARSVGAARASALYSAFVADVLSSLAEAGAEAILCASPEQGAYAYRRWLGTSRQLVFQQGADLGQRMAAAFSWSFASGADRALLVGTDVPQLPPWLVRQAWQRLDDADLVLGPAMDGGYYLIGFQRESFDPAFFRDICWSTRHVLQQTLSRTPRGLRPTRLPRLTDCDTLEDLRTVLGQAPLERAMATRRQARHFGLV